MPSTSTGFAWFVTRCHGHGRTDAVRFRIMIAEHVTDPDMAEEVVQRLSISTNSGVTCWSCAETTTSWRRAVELLA